MAKAIRDIYGETLARLADTDGRIVAMDADVSGSTKSSLFGKAHPDRFFNMGIAESNMAATAAGLAATGRIVFINTFASFLGSIALLSARSQACYANLNVKFAGAYCGLSDALDGATHHATEDIAAMRALPNMRVLVPSDAVSTRALTELAAHTEGPVYLRLSRDEYPDCYPEGTAFGLGGSHVVREGSDVTVFASGILVHKALEAAKKLTKKHIEVRVVDLYSLKPIDRDCILRCARETGAVVCAEEHSVINGMGAAVAQVLCEGAMAVPTAFVGVQDVFTESGAYASLMKKYGMDAEAVESAVLRVLAGKKA